MRQDPQYYALYVALRHDHAWRLISYPYYAKFAKPGDHTSFRYIDISIPKYLETGRGGNLIQGTVAITDDDEENSTLMCLGMHKHLQEWWNMCKARGIAKEDHIHNIEDKMWTKKDKERFQTDFKP